MSRGAGILVATAVACGVVASAAGGHAGPLPESLTAGTAPVSTVVPALPPECPLAVPATGFDPVQRLVADTRFMHELGARPTASPAHETFIDWVERELAQIPGMAVDTVPYTIDRWLETDVALTAGADDGLPTELSASGAVPYAQVTGGVTAPLAYVPAGAPIAGHDVRGKIVVRDVLPGSVPLRNLSAVEWFHYDPDLSLTTDAASGGTYDRDFNGNAQRVADLQDAQDGGAAGLVLAHGLPRAQVRGQYAPYKGTHWKLPAVYVGADEGAQLKQLAAAGGRASLRIAADEGPARTRMLVATLPGASPERIVMQSHTDGMNAIWDNGPIAMLALARHFAALPPACRPRTLQFVFTTAHLYQALQGEHDSGGSAELFAEQLDREYDQGSVALVLALEHLGAREYRPVARADGGPGRSLEPSGRSEMNTIFTGESPALINAIERAVVGHDLRRTYVLRGSDAPGARIPMHRSFGGEGSPYHRHLVPTIAFVTGPWTLYNPAFGMEAFDGELMLKQTLIFGDLLHELASEPTAVLAGGYAAQRGLRTLACSTGLATLGFMDCGS